MRSASAPKLAGRFALAANRVLDLQAYGESYCLYDGIITQRKPQAGPFPGRPGGRPLPLSLTKIITCVADPLVFVVTFGSLARSAVLLQLATAWKALLKKIQRYRSPLISMKVYGSMLLGKLIRAGFFARSGFLGTADLI